jgi:hypothetical protein
MATRWYGHLYRCVSRVILVGFDLGSVGKDRQLLEIESSRTGRDYAA